MRKLIVIVTMLTVALSLTYADGMKIERKKVKVKGAILQGKRLSPNAENEENEVTVTKFSQRGVRPVEKPKMKWVRPTKPVSITEIKKILAEFVPVRHARSPRNRKNVTSRQKADWEKHREIQVYWSKHIYGAPIEPFSFRCCGIPSGRLGNIRYQKGGMDYSIVYPEEDWKKRKKLWKWSHALIRGYGGRVTSRLKGSAPYFIIQISSVKKYLTFSPLF